MDAQKFRRRLVRAREARMMTQSKLARDAGLVDGSVVSRYERGEHLPSVDSLGKLAEALSVSVGWLAGEGSEGVPRAAA
jgi:transcriptional regulator with XRE-family HTH domain